MDKNSIFSDRLKQLRKGHNLSQEELAKLLNVSRSSISSYENNSRSPDKDTLIRLAILFGISVDYLLGVEQLTTNNSQAYLNILLEINNLLQSSPLDHEIKIKIMAEIKDYFIWKMSTATQNQA